MLTSTAPPYISRTDNIFLCRSAVCYSNLTLTNNIRKKFCAPTDICKLEPCLNDGFCEIADAATAKRRGISFDCKCKVPYFGDRFDYILIDFSPKQGQGSCT